MIIKFHIQYHTQWGQQLALVGNHPILGNDSLLEAHKLQYTQNGNWVTSIEIEPDFPLQYRYVLLNDGMNRLDEEWGDMRNLDSAKISTDEIVICDSWRAKGRPENGLYNSAFTSVIFGQEPSKNKKRTTLAAGTIQFSIRAVAIPKGLQVCVLGNHPSLGNWDYSKPLLLSNLTFPTWTGQITTPVISPIEYKYGLYDPSAKRVTQLEHGNNRQLVLSPRSVKNSTVLVADENMNLREQAWKGAGIAIPVFSLRSKTGFGVGEFNDLKALADWAEQTNMQMVQILPINDTTATYTWVDSYPYAAISVFALHPMYLHLQEVEGFSEVVDQPTFAAEQEELNGKEVVDYEQVVQLKLKYAKAIFKVVKKDFLQRKDFKQYLKENQHWLKPYALFCYCRDKYGTADFQQWKEHQTFSESLLKKGTNSRSSHYEEITFQYFLQFYLDRQLKTAAAYTRHKGVVLKGDIPIGIYRNSVDAWMAPQLYNMGGQAGAPPDPFSAAGQNWGFPTYNWAEMAKDDYTWWQNRLRQLSDYFDAFRIDHILGFFRIWEIPWAQIEGTMGFFNPALPIWLEEFEERGISFSEERYCRPYITEEVLKQSFGDRQEEVKSIFLTEVGESERWQLRKEFNTQRKVKEFLEQEENAGLQDLQAGLLSLIGNVIFFRAVEQDKAAYHPRIDSTKTSSFQALPPLEQQRVRDLYNDYFYHRQENFWRKQAMTKLPAIKQATNMLICGEDLGMVPACVPGVMKELDFFSLEIQRMSKNPASEFLQADDIPYLSVCSPSTHDMSPVRAWWEESERAQIQRFYQQELGFQGEAPYFCEPFVAQAIFQQHLSWPSMWAVFPIQDILAVDTTVRRTNPFDERINEPSNPQHYWRYRLHITLEELQEQTGLNRWIRDMLVKSGRS
ncbi:MAG: 4-alpha-glucanotransferase [Saprospiraceae bacterium]|nr:4-alpha-glucanotransferase [Saprospiraceae bacterium]